MCLCVLEKCPSFVAFFYQSPSFFVRRFKGDLNQSIKQAINILSFLL